MSDTLVCWRCGALLDWLGSSLGRLDECRDCGADLHVCRLCEFYDARISKQCREPIAEEVKDKERSNFCDYFRPAPGAYRAPAETQSPAALAALFGTAPGADGSTSATAQERSDRARQDLERLFGLPDREKE